MLLGGVAVTQSPRFAAEIRHRLAEDAVDGVAFPLVEAALEFGNPTAHDIDRRAYRRGGDDPVYADIHAWLFAREQYLVEPLAGPNAGKDDVNITPRLQTAQTDHALGEFDDFDRLAHVEHIDGCRRPRGTERVTGRRDHEIARFANGHEIANHVRVRDGPRPASLDLGFELRHHRTVGRQHIAEAHRDHAGWRLAAVGAACGAGVQSLTVHFGQPLGGAEHRYRLGAPLAREPHHRFGAGGDRCICDIHRSKHVGLDPLAPFALDDRYVLECGGVEHQVRLGVRDQAENSLAIADIGDAALDGGGSRFGCERFQHAF